MAKRSIVFVDGHPLYRDGLIHAFGSAIDDLRVVTASDAAEAQALLDDAVCLCLSDRQLPDGLGIDVLAGVRRRWPAVATGVLASDVTKDLCLAVRNSGGTACLSKSRDGRALAEAIRTILAGGTVFDADMPASSGVLTDRRRDIVRMAAQGWGDKKICSHLAITQSGVRRHWQHIFGRLGANNRTEAVTKAMHLRLI